MGARGPDVKGYPLWLLQHHKGGMRGRKSGSRKVHNVCGRKLGDAPRTGAPPKHPQEDWRNPTRGLYNSGPISPDWVGPLSRRRGVSTSLDGYPNVCIYVYVRPARGPPPPPSQETSKALPWVTVSIAESQQQCQNHHPRTRDPPIYVKGKQVSHHLRACSVVLSRHGLANDDDYA